MRIFKHVLVTCILHWRDSTVYDPALSLCTTQQADESRWLLRRIANSSIITYADSGHAAILQHGLTNAKLISAWLDEDAVEATGVQSA